MRIPPLRDIPWTRVHAIWGTLGIGVILGAAAIYADLTRPTPSWEVTMDPLAISTADDLADLYKEHDYTWPPRGMVPRIALKSLPTDLGDQQVSEKKALFFRIILPLVLAENRSIRTQRQFLQDAFANGKLKAGSAEAERAQAIAKRYRVSGDLNDPKVRARLLARVDEVPVALALAQAANESGWGTSRFALSANNLFGLWTYDEDKGVVPKDRAEDANHLVRSFSSLRAAVHAYIHNINTGHAYKRLRALRAQMRSQGQALAPMRLAEGLSQYSERGEAYVRDIQQMMRSNHLVGLTPLHLGKL